MVQGLADLKRRWSAVPESVRMNLRAEMEAIANDIVDEMYSQAPHDTGDLAGSIGWTWGDAPAGALTIGTVGGREYGTMRITVYVGGRGSPGWYARFLEFGTQKMTARPFFYPVWRARRKRVRARITRAISKGIRDA